MEENKMTEDMKPRSEADAKTLIDEHLRNRGWNLTDFFRIRKEYPTPANNYVDYIFFDKNGKPVAILEAKKPGKDLYGALEQVKDYAREFQTSGIDVYLIFASDGKNFLKKNLIISSFLSGRGKIYIHMATGAGKTAVAAALIAKLFTIGKIKKVLYS